MVCESDLSVEIVGKFKHFAPRIITLVIVAAISFAVTAVLISIFGLNPGEVYQTLFSGAFGSPSAFAVSLNRANPILLCGLGLILAYKGGIWNIGAEGQLYIGALTSVVVGLFITGVPGPIHIFLMLAAGFIGGAIWGLIPALLRVRFKTNILITTLLMNFIAIWLVYYAVRFPLKSESSFNPITEFIAPTARLPVLLGTSAHSGILITIALAVLVWYILDRTVLGYRIKAMGANPIASLYSGMPVNRVTIITMILSGGLCGLAGMGEVSGVNYILHQRISADFGFLAIAIVFIGGLNPWRTVVASIFFGGLMVGARTAQATHGLPLTIMHVFLAMWMITLLMAPVIEKRLTQLLNGRKKVQRKLV
ncbi:ABC transporter permease [Chloroflexota bacterium]